MAKFLAADDSRLKYIMKSANLVGAIARIAVKLFISAGLIALVLRNVDISGVYVQITTAKAFNIAVAFALTTGIALIQSERWRRVLGQLGVKLPYGDAIRLTLISYFFNQTLPSTVGGDAFRVWGAYRRGVSIHDAVSSVIVDRIIALASLLILIAAGLPWLTDLFQSPSTLWILCSLVAASIIGIVLLLLSNRLGSLLSRWRLGRVFMSVVVCARVVFLNIRVAISVTVLSIFSYVIISFMVYFLARGMLIDLEFKHSLLLMPLIILLTILPVSIAGWGVREGAMIMLLGLVGIPSEQALALSILVGIVALVSGLPGGLIWLIENYGQKNRVTSNWPI